MVVYGEEFTKTYVAVAKGVAKNDSSVNDSNVASISLSDLMLRSQCSVVFLKVLDEADDAKDAEAADDESGNDDSNEDSCTETGASNEEGCEGFSGFLHLFLVLFDGCESFIVFSASLFEADTVTGLTVLLGFGVHSRADSSPLDVVSTNLADSPGTDVL